MSSRKTHGKDCLQILGKEFPEVHLWMDALFQREEPCLGDKHRPVRHNQQGVEEVRKRWGDEAAVAAEIHIRRDLKFFLPNMWNLDMDAPLPKDAEEYRIVAAQQGTF